KAIKGNKIIVKKAQAGTVFTTLDKQERKLDGSELMICNAEEPMALAGVFGGLHSGINTETTDILLESAYFSSSAVRATSRKHQLFTDASFRFERGTDPNICVDALRRIADIILDIAGGEVQNPAIDIYPKPIAPKIIDLEYALVDRIAGTQILRNEMKAILSGMEIKILQENNEVLQLQIPSVKYDVTRPVDVIEEILRVYSFDKIPVPQHVSSVLQVNKLQHRETRRKRIDDFLVSNGFYESYHLSFVKESENQLISVEKSGIRVLNPLSAELEFMRTSTLIAGLKSVAHNLNRQQSNVKLFKWGTTFNLEDEKIHEKQTLSMWLTGNSHQANWHTNAAKTDFFMAKAYIESIMQLGGAKKVTTEAFSGDSIYAYGLNYILKGEIVATVGMLNKNICKEMDIAQEVLFVEADAKFVLESGKTETRYSPISKFPRVERDLSLTVPQNVNYGQIRETVNKLDSRLIKKLYIFDVYEGNQVKEGFKSYAIRLEFEDAQKTLEDKVVEKIMNNLATRLETDLHVEIRKA
ncbi:MAG: phenylalanine--tRNA ligase subunit beta, partial [Bacteroidia bacterium]